MRKLIVMLFAVLFSFSVSGMLFAEEPALDKDGKGTGMTKVEKKEKKGKKDKKDKKVKKEKKVEKTEKAK